MSVPAFSRDTVLEIHSTVVARFGGLGGVRDEGLLESALAQPFQTFDGRDLYPDAVNKASRYAFGIICDHPFVDGNKRTATALMGTYLRMSGLAFKPDHDALLKVMLGVADGTLDYDGLVGWVRSVVA